MFTMDTWIQTRWVARASWTTTEVPRSRVVFKGAEYFVYLMAYAVSGNRRFHDCDSSSAYVIYRKVECIFVDLLILPKKREYVERVQKRIITR